jgi:His-Xaa-Ser repeat protein HxsA
MSERSGVMKSPLFTIPSFFAAGLIPTQALSQGDNPGNAEETKGFLDQIEEIVSNISESHSYTLAQHRSHASHGSHGSHGSHRSGGGGPFHVPPVSLGGDEVASATSYERENGRNEMSTPRSTILPSSPAIIKKVKVLPGNSQKFKDVVMRLQIALASRGHSVGEINGEVDAVTIAAIYDYQSQSGMVPSGKVTNEVLGSFGLIAQ